MTDSHPENDPPEEDRAPMHAEFQHRAVTARIPEEVADGSFANAAIVLSGQFEFVLDFVLRMGKPDRVMSRVILPVPVVDQFVQTLRDSLEKYEQQFGPIPEMKSPRPTGEESPQTGGKAESGIVSPGGFVGTTGPEGGISPTEGMSQQKNPPPIDEIYDDLKLTDQLLGGTYANAVLIRHSASEFCFDFVTNIYPRSCVTARVFMSVLQVPSLLTSLGHAFEQFRQRHKPPEHD